MDQARQELKRAEPQENPHDEAIRDTKKRLKKLEADKATLKEQQQAL